MGWILIPISMRKTVLLYLQTLENSSIGKFGKDLVTVTKEDTLFKALEIISDQKFTAIPVVDENGKSTFVCWITDHIFLVCVQIYN